MKTLKTTVWMVVLALGGCQAVSGGGGGGDPNSGNLRGPGIPDGTYRGDGSLLITHWVNSIVQKEQTLPQTLYAVIDPYGRPVDLDSGLPIVEGHVNERVMGETYFVDTTTSIIAGSDSVIVRGTTRATENGEVWTGEFEVLYKYLSADGSLEAHAEYVLANDDLPGEHREVCFAYHGLLSR